MSNNNYTKDNIETLSLREAMRMRVGMYLGSANMEGVYQAIREIITNSIDEYTIKENDYIEVILNEKEITVIDRGRGVPFGERKDGVDAMVAIFTMAHTGGKFDQKSYQNVAGLHGTGGKAAALTADNFYAESVRDGQVAKLTMKDGFVKEFKIEKRESKGTGTKIIFTPAQEVFNLEPIKIDFNVIKDMCKTWAYLSPGLNFKLENKKTKEVVNYRFDDGIKNLIQDKMTKPVHKTIITRSVDDGNGNYVEIAMQWSKKRQEFPNIFTNGLEQINGGTSMTGARSGITRTVNNLSGVRLSGDSVRMGLHYVVSASVPLASFSDQTKTRINNPELRSLADRAVSEALTEFSQKHKKEWEDLIDVLVREEQAEKAAEAAREKILNVEKDLEKPRKSNLELPSKIADATNKTGYRELHLSEGNSASAYLISTRDAATQGVIPLRGKILNSYELELHEAYENEEVRSIFQLLGSGAGSSYNAKKLRYEKVIIATDGDVDGHHIAILIIGLLLRHTPKLIEDGKLYRLIPPFYGVGKGKNYKLLYSEQELRDYESKHGKQKDIDRFKGLGAMSEELTGKYLMNPKYRRLEQIRMDDLNEMRELFDTLMGNDVQGRRDLVAKGRLDE